MIIDIHTHIFPEKIADSVLSNAEANLGLPKKATGTERGLREHMAISGTDLSIVLAVAPEPRLVKRTNDWLLSIRDSRLQFFGTIHPDMDDWEYELVRLKREGVKGIKFNALIQGIRPDDERMFPLYDWMEREGMVVLFHSGASHRQRDDLSKVISTPERIARVVDQFPKLKVIAAHYGGNHMLEEARRHLYGRDLYLDTSYPPDVSALRSEFVLQIIRTHGAHKVLFGTDYPWESQIDGIRYINGLGLKEYEKEAILGGNAKRLLFG
jgi:predicted TIM-barrel fold metal-dependent hydrolase